MIEEVLSRCSLSFTPSPPPQIPFQTLSLLSLPTTSTTEQLLPALAYSKSNFNLTLTPHPPTSPPSLPPPPFILFLAPGVLDDPLMCATILKVVTSNLPVVTWFSKEWRFGGDEVKKARGQYEVLGSFFDGHECLPLRSQEHEIRCLVDETIRRLSNKEF